MSEEYNPYPEREKEIQLVNTSKEEKTIIDFVKEMELSFNNWIYKCRDLTFDFYCLLSSAEELFSENENKWSWKAGDIKTFKIYEEGETCFDYIMYRLLRKYGGSTSSFIWTILF